MTLAVNVPHYYAEASLAAVFSAAVSFWFVDDSLSKVAMIAATVAGAHLLSTQFLAQWVMYGVGMGEAVLAFGTAKN